MRLVSVAAVAENGVIGDDGAVPWPSLPEDVVQYRERVAGSPVILGRRTFDSMRDDLPGSEQIVVSRSVDAVDEPSAVVAHGVDEALSAARASVGVDAGTDAGTDADAGTGTDADTNTGTDTDTVYILGGASIYELFQPLIDTMILSHVAGRYDGDATFPRWDDTEWTVTTQTAYDGFTLREWNRKTASA